jgi:hypothetical protein
MKRLQVNGGLIHLSTAAAPDLFAPGISRVRP